MMNKQIKSILLKENFCCEDLEVFLNVDYKEVIKEIFNVLLESLKNSTHEEIDLVMSNIELFVETSNNIDYKIVNNAVREANYKLNGIKANIDDKVLKNIKFRLIALNRQINISREKVDNLNIFNFYHYLLFEERNINMVELLLKTENNILNKKDDYGNDLFTNVIDNYCSLEETDELIDYYYEVINLFLKYLEDKLIKSERQKYIDLLERSFCKNKNHVRKILKRFDEYYLIDAKDLEKKYHVTTKIHDKAIEELNDFVFDVSGRKKFNSNFITIDDEDALCLDDAISLVKNKDGSFCYYVAITDIPSLIPYGSYTFYDALKKEETIYLCDKNINLYHESIANNLCSLLPNSSKNVIIYKVFADPSFNINPESLEIHKGIITVRNRLSYKQVNKQEILDVETGKMLENIALLSYKLRSQNKAKEMYRFIENTINSNAIWHHSMYTDKSISANIIQESMLLVNHLAPKYFLDRGLIYTYRNHKFPTDNIVNSEVDRLLNLSKTNISENEIKKIFNMIRDNYLNAYYSIINEGHQGLNYDVYSHSTSPGRRACDGFNQYLTYEQLFKGTVSDKKHYILEATTKEVVEYINCKKKENDKFASEYNYLHGKQLIRKK